MTFSRRQFIQASGVTLCAAALSLNAKVENRKMLLPIPPLLESWHGQPLFLALQHSHWSFSSRNNKVLVWGFNGLHLGPTVRVWNGDNVKLIYNNRLDESVAMSIGGLLVPGTLSDSAQRMMSPGVDWAPVFPVRQSASTCWYHAMTPNRMAQHIYNGLAGMWLIEDEISKSLPIPKHYGVDDFPMIIQDKRFNSFGIPIYNPPENCGFVGDTLLVNGVQNPFVKVSRGWVRLRMLNASNSRRYEIALSNRRSFYVIASDQGFLTAPVIVKNLSLAPGERREVLLDMSCGEEVSITTSVVGSSIIDRLRRFFESSGILMSTSILTLIPTELLPLMNSSLPMQLLTDYIFLNNAPPVRTRELNLGDTQPGINGTKWDKSRIDIQAKQGTCERWIIRASMPQAFHIQGVRFLVKSINGAQPPSEDCGWKDTVWIDGEVELLVVFTQPSSQNFPFIYYSQTLEMADRGTAGQLLVQPNQEEN